jgi:hypothetical protein
MDKWRRRARAHNPKRASRQHGHEEAQRPDGQFSVERVSEYSIRQDAVNENQAGSAEDHPEGASDQAASDKAEPAGIDEATDLTAVGEEVQTVLSSAHDAAVKIRRKAEDEAERILGDARAAAQAEISDAQLIAAAHREDAERVRAEAEGFATERRAAAEAFEEERRTTAERDAARILEEAQHRLSAADAEAAQKVGRAEAEEAQRLSALRDDIKRHEERLESILVILRDMSSQVEGVLGRRDASDENDDTSAESLEDVLQVDRSRAAAAVPASDERVRSTVFREEGGEPSHEEP